MTIMTPPNQPADPADPMRALPFAALQRRLGRKEPDAAVLAEVPAQFVAYDALAWDGALIVEEPYEARRARDRSIPDRPSCSSSASYSFGYCMRSSAYSRRSGSGCVISRATYGTTPGWASAIVATASARS